MVINQRSQPIFISNNELEIIITALQFQKAHSIVNTADFDEILEYMIEKQEDKS